MSGREARRVEFIRSIAGMKNVEASDAISQWLLAAGLPPDLRPAERRDLWLQMKAERARRRAGTEAPRPYTGEDIDWIAQEASRIPARSDMLRKIRAEVGALYLPLDERRRVTAKVQELTNKKRLDTNTARLAPIAKYLGRQS